jgi:hypothetical protein
VFTWPEQVLEKRCSGSLAVLAQADDLGTLPDVEDGASWPAAALQRMWPEPGGRMVMRGKEPPEAELPARTADQELVSARTYQRLGADCQGAVFARLG